MPVSVGMLSMRLFNVHDGLSIAARKSLDGINRTGEGQRVYETMRTYLDTLVAFSMKYAIVTTLKAEHAHAVLESLFIIGLTDLIVFEGRFEHLDPKKSRFTRGSAEYMLAGLAFQELCGDMGNRQLNDGVRQFGAELFSKLFLITKKELESVRIM
jgi:hypothetical protein